METQNNSNKLKENLEEIGFEQAQFEPKTSRRFMVKIDGIPSYVIKKVTLPKYDGKWTGPLHLECYNPLGAELEKKILDLTKERNLSVEVLLLDPVGKVDTEWRIIVVDPVINFNGFDWSDEMTPNTISIDFSVTDAAVSYTDI